MPQITDVASDLQQQGLAVDIVIDRATASRFGITPATIDNVLYDAFGQRIVSTIYTQSNQYRVIMEVDPTLQQSLTGLTSLYLPSSSSTTNGQVPLTAIAHIESARRAAVDHAFRSISGDDDLVQHRAGLFARMPRSRRSSRPKRRPACR